MEKIVANSSDEVTLKEVFRKISDFASFLYRKKVIVLSFGILGLLVGFLYSYFEKPKYISKITFVLEESKSGASSLGNLASLAGQFGVDMGINATSGGGLLAGDNILLYFKSPSLAREVLLSRYDSSSNESIANLYINVYGLKTKWESNDEIGAVSFPIIQRNIKYSRIQDSLLQLIIYDIHKKQFNISRIDKKAGFIEVATSMQNEILAKSFCERIVQRVVERYISLKTERQTATVNNLQKRVDSIADLLRRKTVVGASIQNSSNTMDINPLYKTNTTVAVESTMRDKTLLGTIFASVTQNLEMAKFTLSQETPVIQIIDSPILPLKRDNITKTKAMILGFFIFLSFSVIFISIKRYFNKEA